MVENIKYFFGNYIVSNNSHARDDIESHEHVEYPLGYSKNIRITSAKINIYNTLQKHILNCKHFQRDVNSLM